MNQKNEFALKAMQTDNFRPLCQEYAISPKTGYKRKERFIQRGLDGLREDSRRPVTSPAALPEADVCKIVRIQRSHLNWGLARSARTHAHPPSESSFKRVLERAGFTEKRVLRRKGGQSVEC